jgi:flavin reductase (DIM6/NTAB) family NADH-FMN oxidoreductase RutF
MEKARIPNRPFGPFPAMLVGSERGGKASFATVGACGVVCLEPVLHVSLRATHCTAAGVRETGFFSINVPSSTMVEVTDFCGMVSGHDVDKAERFTLFRDPLGQAPMLLECPLNVLCRVIRTIEIFDFQMFLGEIVATFASPEVLTEGRPDPRKVDPMILLGDGYWSLGERAGTIFQAGAGLLPKG